MKAGRFIRVMAVIVLLAFSFAVVGCAGPQKKEAPGASGGKQAAQPTQEAKASRTDVAIPPLPADGNYDCADFETQAQAQEVLEQTLATPTTSTARETVYPARICPQETAPLRIRVRLLTLLPYPQPPPRPRPVRHGRPRSEMPSRC